MFMFFSYMVEVQLLCGDVLFGVFGFGSKIYFKILGIFFEVILFGPLPPALIVFGGLLSTIPWNSLGSSIGLPVVELDIFVVGRCNLVLVVCS